jgi:uncharacterized protein (DUF1015 family)
MLRMDTTPDGMPRLVLHPFRALRLRDTFIGAPVANRVFARPYRSVPGRLRDWRRQRHLQVDRRAGLYVHEYTSAGVSVRGIVATLELGPAHGAVLPHEDVHPRQVEQLARRMREMQLNPAPILLMHRGGPTLRDTVDSVTATAPQLSFTDRGEQLHRIWRIEDADLQRRIGDVIASHRMVIADGHHRYAAAVELRAEMPGTGWERTLVMLVDQSDTPLQLGAIHRTIAGLTLSRVEAAARERGDAFQRHDSRHEALDQLEHALVLHDGLHWATLRPAARALLPVCILHDQLLPAWQISESRLDFHHTAAEALANAGRGVAVLLPAPTFDQVEQAAAAGVLLPQKATSFQPKPHLGAIMRDLRDE